MNQYDGSAIASILRKAGMLPAGTGQKADLIVIVTCCVTKVAMSKSRQAIRKMLRRSPAASVIAAGCYSDYHADKLTELLSTAGVGKANSLVLGHHDDLAGQIASFVASMQTTPPAGTHLIRPREQVSSSAKSGPAPQLAPVGEHAPSGPESLKARRIEAISARRDTPGLAEVDGFAGRQRAFVKVQDGCDAFCTYCIVPYVRCRVWSRPIDEIEAECRRLVAAGHREIVLSGVFLGAFGRDTAIRRKWDSTPAKLPELVTRIAAIDGLWRVRLSSLEPGDLTDELLHTCSSTPNIAPHFHLPLQSGSDDVLGGMNRQYRSGEFRDCVDRLRSAMDAPAITTDIIVGFPGETDDDFAETLEMARYAGFAKIHAFPFSAIEPTAAWQRRSESPQAETVRRRIAELSELEAQLAEDYRKRFVGTVMEALVESPRQSDNGQRVAMTDRYLKAFFTPQKAAFTPQKAAFTPQKAAFAPTQSDSDLTGQVISLRIDKVTNHGLDGVQA